MFSPLSPENDHQSAPPPAADFCASLFREHVRDVWGYFHNRGLGPEDCDELVSETFVNVTRSAGGFRQAASPKTWLFSIAKNVWANYWRANKAEKRDGVETSLDDPDNTEGGQHPVDPAPDPESAALAKDRAEKLDAAITRLPRKMQRCVKMRLQGLAYREIAVAMKVDISTVKAHIHQAKQKLARDLKSEFGDVSL